MEYTFEEGFQRDKTITSFRISCMDNKRNISTRSLMESHKELGETDVHISVVGTETTYFK